MKISDNKFGADLWPLQRGSVRLSGLCGADRCGFSLQAGAPRRVLCHTLQSGLGVMLKRRDFPCKLAARCLQYLYLPKLSSKLGAIRT